MLNSLIDDSVTVTDPPSRRDEGTRGEDQQRDTPHLASLEQRHRAQSGALDALTSRISATSSFLTRQLVRLLRVKKSTGGRTMNAKVGHASRVHVHTRVMAEIAPATPQRLVAILHRGALKAAVAAKTALVQGDVQARGAAISKTITIIGQGLRPALSVNAGNPIAADLIVLYGYIVNRLSYADLRGHAASLDEVVHLLQELGEAWEALEWNSRAVTEERLQPQRSRDIALNHGEV